MGETTGIGWTDATQNFWEGCTKVGPGCDHCYAEARDARWHAGSHWGPGAPRRRTINATFNRPVAWNAARERYNASMAIAGGVWSSTKIPPLWVFAMSLGDFFDNEVPRDWRDDAWAVIARCTALRWQVVTKRVGNVPKMLPADWDPAEPGPYQHVGVIATIVNQEEADRDLYKLCLLKEVYGVKWVGISAEPLLGRLDLKPWVDKLDWVIIGGESRQGGQEARPFDFWWADDIINACEIVGTPVFMKQAGSFPHYASVPKRVTGAGTDPAEWPKRVFNNGSPDRRWPRQMPKVYG